MLIEKEITITFHFQKKIVLLLGKMDIKISYFGLFQIKVIIKVDMFIVATQMENQMILWKPKAILE